MPLGNPNAPEDVVRISTDDDVTIGWDAASILEIAISATGKKVTLPGDPTKAPVGARPGRGSTETGKVTSTAASVVTPRSGTTTMRRGRVLIANVGGASDQNFVIAHDNIYGLAADDALNKNKAQRFVWVPRKLASDSKDTGYWAFDGAEYTYDV